MSITTKTVDEMKYVVYDANANPLARIGDLEAHEYVIEDLAKIEPNQPFLLNHWNHEPWFSRKTDVMGSGPHRLNQVDRDGFAWRQYRFATIDEMIEFLCHSTQRLYRVTQKDSQYWVRTHYMEGY